jgi:hypothetical protein
MDAGFIVASARVNGDNGHVLSLPRLGREIPYDLAGQVLKYHSVHKFINWNFVEVPDIPPPYLLQSGYAPLARCLPIISSLLV